MNTEGMHVWLAKAARSPAAVRWKRGRCMVQLAYFEEEDVVRKRSSGTSYKTMDKRHSLPDPDGWGQHTAKAIYVKFHDARHSTDPCIRKGDDFGFRGGVGGLKNTTKQSFQRILHQMAWNPLV